MYYSDDFEDLVMPTEAVEGFGNGYSSKSGMMTTGDVEDIDNDCGYESRVLSVG